MLCLSTTLVWAGHVDLTIIAPTLNEDGTQCTDLAGFKLYIGKISGTYLDKIDIGNNTNPSWTNLQDGTVYCFVATAYDTSGNESKYSNEVCKVAVADVDTIAPSPPVLQ